VAASIGDAASVNAAIIGTLLPVSIVSLLPYPSPVGGKLGSRKAPVAESRGCFRPSARRAVHFVRTSV
jgi:hypothetical protein